MVGVGHEDRRQLVEAQYAVGLGVVDLGRFGSLFQAGVVRLGIVQGDRNLAAEPVLIDVVECAAQQRAKLVDRRAKVTRCKQLVVQPAGLEVVDVTGQLIAAFTASLEGFNHSLASQHAGFHGSVAALDLGEVQGAQIAADQCAAREDHLRQGVQAAFTDGASAVGNTLAAFQILLDYRVVLVTLEFIERRQVRVSVGQVDDQTNHNLVVLDVVQEGATGVLGADDIQRPASGVNH